MHARKLLLLSLIAALLGGCRSTPSRSNEPQAVSLLGEPLHAPALPEERRGELEARLAEAEARLRDEPHSEEAAIWVGRRLAYLGEYRRAIDAFSAALEQHPHSYELLRHRGHRWLTVREIDLAASDLARAAERMRGLPDELEPDGAPNASGIPRSTKQGNVLYHLALAHYLRGEFEPALASWRGCRALARNDDMRVAADYWIYLCLRRLGRREEALAVAAATRAPLDVIENHDYLRLLRFFDGALSDAELLLPLERGSIAEASVGYGYGAWQLVEGRPEQARALFERVVAGESWPAFGHLAAEAELARELRHFGPSLENGG